MNRRIILLSSLLLAASVTPTLAQLPYAPTTNDSQADFALDPMPQIQQQNGVSYITGGIGDEEREALKAAAHQFNLKVLNAATDGDFVGTAGLTITDTKGAPLLTVTSVDPIFYAQLPAGSYVVEETYDGQTKRQNVKIGKGKMANLGFYWK